MTILIAMANKKKKKLEVWWKIGIGLVHFIVILQYENTNI